MMPSHFQPHAPEHRLPIVTDINNTLTTLLVTYPLTLLPLFDQALCDVQATCFDEHPRKNEMVCGAALVRAPVPPSSSRLSGHPSPHGLSRRLRSSD